MATLPGGHDFVGIKFVFAMFVEGHPLIILANLFLNFLPSVYRKRFKKFLLPR